SPPGCGRCQSPVPLTTGPFERRGWRTLIGDEPRVLMVAEALRDPDGLTTDWPPLVRARPTLLRRLVEQMMGFTPP
ncbi:MAG: hypothetical protein ACP5QO_10085, partial [Clostridia bacterium]